MEHSEYDIKMIEAGNYWLDKWLNAEEQFISFLINSHPLQYIFCELYKIMVYLEELVKFELLDENDKIELETRAISWCINPEPAKLIRLCKAVAVLGVLADKRLKLTTGV